MENLSSDEQNNVNPTLSPLPEEDISLTSESQSNQNTTNITPSIPPNLLQIINDLTKDLDDEYNKTNNASHNNTHDENTQDINKDDYNEENITSDSDNDDDETDIDENFNEFNPNKTNNFEDSQIVTRSQIHSVINNRDQIFMHKGNYLYF